ncbi:MAG: DUF5131 family protein, partial [Planctomycetales bacterium]|nr:DUF5131 family protein [Planctomycetales bacterium]
HGQRAYRQDGEVVGVWGKDAPRRTFGDNHWKQPAKWNRQAHREGRRHKVFCSSMTDVFLDDRVIAAELAKLWPVIRSTPWLDWQLLTKRPERIAGSLPDDWDQGFPNVWLGTSIESNDYASRADHLRNIPAVVRFISYEPALGPLDKLNLAGLDWIIYGGESGNGSKNYRPEDKQWARDMHFRCSAGGVAFFHKQSAGIRTETGIELDGKIVRHFPIPRRVRSRDSRQRKMI